MKFDILNGISFFVILKLYLDLDFIKCADIRVFKDY